MPVNRLERMAISAGLSSGRRFLRGRVRTGLIRSRNSLLPAIQMTVCAVGAYAFAEYVLGHTGPLFAATSSLIALGFSREPRLRRVVEVGLGCTIGIAVGDLLLHWLGDGIWVAAVVLMVSILLARFWTAAPSSPRSWGSSPCWWCCCRRPPAGPSPAAWMPWWAGFAPCW